MDSKSRIRSEPFHLRSDRSDKENFTLRSHQSYSINSKIAVSGSQSPKMSKVEKMLFNSKYTNLAPGAMVVFPPSLKEREGYLNYFSRKAFDNKTDRSIPGERRPYQTIKKTMTREEVGLVVDTSKRKLAKLQEIRSLKIKGSMHLGELWTKKQINSLVKVSELTRVYEAAKGLEREGLPEKLNKLESLYDKKQEVGLGMMNVDKIMDHFYNNGLNAPNLRFDTGNKEALQTVSSMGSLTSLVGIGEKERTGRSRRLSRGTTEAYTNSRQDTRTTLSEDFGNQSNAAYVKSLGDEQLQEAKGNILRKKRSSTKIVLPQFKGTLNSIGESLQDLDEDTHLASISPTNARTEKNILINKENNQSIFVNHHRALNSESSRGNESARTLGMKLAIEKIKNEKEKGSIMRMTLREVRDGENFSSNSNKEIEELLKSAASKKGMKKEESGKSKIIEKDFTKIQPVTRTRKHTRSQWLVPCKNKTLWSKKNL